MMAEGTSAKQQLFTCSVCGSIDLVLAERKPFGTLYRCSRCRDTLFIVRSNHTGVTTSTRTGTINGFVDDTIDSSMDNQDVDAFEF